MSNCSRIVRMRSGQSYRNCSILGTSSIIVISITAVTATASSFLKQIDTMRRGKRSYWKLVKLK